MAKNTRKTATLDLWLTPEAKSGFNSLIKPGLKRLDQIYQKTNINPAESAQAIDEIGKLEQQIENIRGDIRQLNISKEFLMRQKRFWREEKKQLISDLKNRRKVVIKTFDTTGDEIWIDPISGLPSVDKEIDIYLDSRRDKAEAQRKITWWAINIADPSIQDVTARAKLLDEKIGARQKTIANTQQEIDDWKEAYVPVVKDDSARLAQWWKEFLAYMTERGTRSFSFEGRGIEHLKNVGAHVYKYKRGKGMGLRVIFRAFPEKPGYYHILKVTLRDEKTYNINLRSSDQEWKRQR